MFAACPAVAYDLSMDRRFIGILLFVVLVMASVPLVSHLLKSDEAAPPPDAPVVQTLELEDDRRVHITSRTVQPLMATRLALYYETEPASSAGDAPQPAFFGSLPPSREPPRFLVHRTSDGELVGVAAASDPNALLILHDFETGASWPRHDLVEGQEQLDARGQQLLERLRSDLPEGEELHLVRAEGLRPLEDLIDRTANEQAPAETQ